ncbi:MAG: glycosyltransferase family 4 protein [Planctomycetota bacterium]
MKVLLLAPGSAELNRGPAETVSRYRAGLMRRGHLCEVFGDSGQGGIKRSLAGTILRFRPDVVHAHDAWATGVELLGLRLPWVVSISGDELHARLTDTTCGPQVCEVLREANRVLVPAEALTGVVERVAPEAVGKIDVVPRAAHELPAGGTDLRRSLGIPRQRVLILLPGALRRVKAQHEAFPLIATLRRSGIDAELVIVGPEQDRAYAEELREFARGEPRVRVLPPLSRERMGASYRNADMVLVTSQAEGMSPVILEAGLLGRPVVARDIPSNRELIRHRESGLLFDDGESLARCVVALVKNRAAAGAMGVRLREDLGRRFDPDLEIDRLLSAYAAA